MVGGGEIKGKGIDDGIKKVGEEKADGDDNEEMFFFHKTDFILKSNVESSIVIAAGPRAPFGGKIGTTFNVEVGTSIDAGDGFPLNIPGTRFVDKSIESIGGAAGVVELGDFVTVGGLFFGWVDFVASDIFDGDSTGSGHGAKESGVSFVREDREHEGG